MTVRGCFITLEGVDGAGKSTHAAWIADYLRSRGRNVLATREPGGTPLGETLRALAQVFAARCEHLGQVIEPALAAGTWVVCDRYTDATYAYQGGGRELGAERIAVLERWMHPQLQPDRTWLFDVPLDVARKRLADSRQPDRFEREEAAFFERTRAAYHERARQAPRRMRIVDSTRPVQQVREQLQAELEDLLRGLP